MRPLRPTAFRPRNRRVEIANVSPKSPLEASYLLIAVFTPTDLGNQSLQLQTSDQATLCLRIPVNVPLGRFDRGMPSQQLHVAQ